MGKDDVEEKDNLTDSQENNFYSSLKEEDKTVGSSEDEKDILPRMGENVLKENKTSSDNKESSNQTSVPETHVYVKDQMNENQGASIEAGSTSSKDVLFEKTAEEEP